VGRHLPGLLALALIIGGLVADRLGWLHPDRW
jgi:hypothetical protein